MKDEAFQALRRDIQDRIAGEQLTRPQIRELREIMAERLDPSSKQEVLIFGPNGWKPIDPECP